MALFRRIVDNDPACWLLSACCIFCFVVLFFCLFRLVWFGLDFLFSFAFCFVSHKISDYSFFLFETSETHTPNPLQAGNWHSQAFVCLLHINVYTDICVHALYHMMIIIVINVFFIKCAISAHFIFLLNAKRERVNSATSFVRLGDIVRLI